MLQLIGHTSAGNFTYSSFGKRVWVDTKRYYGQRVSFKPRSPHTDKWLSSKSQPYVDIVLLFSYSDKTMLQDPSQIVQVAEYKFADMSFAQFQRFCEDHIFDTQQQEIICIYNAKHFLRNNWRPSFKTETNFKTGA